MAGTPAASRGWGCVKSDGKGRVRNVHDKATRSVVLRSTAENLFGMSTKLLEGSVVLFQTLLGAVQSCMSSRTVHEGLIDCKTHASCFL